MDVQKDVKNPDGSLRFNVSEINAIPIGGYALQLIAMLVFAWLSSRTGKRATWIVVQMVRYSLFISIHPVSLPFLHDTLAPPTVAHIARMTVTDD